MPTFRYQTLSTNGDTAVIDAPDRAAAIRQLRLQGVTPTKLEPLSRREARRAASQSSAALSAGSGAQATRRPGKGSMSRSEMAMFIRELATAVQAGLPLVQSLKTIERQLRHAGQKAIIAQIIHEVEHGRSLADACAKVGKPFGELTVSLMRAGEASGRLGEILDQTANLLDRDVKLRRTLLTGSIYPAILVVLIAGAIGVIVGFIVPKIVAPFVGKMSLSKLPFPTRVVLAVGDFFKDYWYVVLIAVGLSIVTWVVSYRNPKGRLAIDRALLRVPLLGKVLRDVAVARFTRTLGTLVSSGLPALTALRVTKATLGNKAMEQVLNEVCDQVASGKTISDPMERSGYFPSLLNQIIGLGERSGRLPQMLLQAAAVFEDRTETSVKIFTSNFPVAMVLLAAPVIGFVMAAILLVLIQAQDMIQ